MKKTLLLLPAIALMAACESQKSVSQPLASQTGKTVNTGCQNTAQNEIDAADAAETNVLIPSLTVDYTANGALTLTYSDLYNCGASLTSNCRLDAENKTILIDIDDNTNEDNLMDCVCQMSSEASLTELPEGEYAYRINIRKDGAERQLIGTLTLAGDLHKVIPPQELRSTQVRISECISYQPEGSFGVKAEAVTPGMSFMFKLDTAGMLTCLTEIHEHCGAELTGELTVDTSDMTIRIDLVDHAEAAANCICPRSVECNATGVQPGAYSVMVTRSSANLTQAMTYHGQTTLTSGGSTLVTLNP